jgi:GNAT superfamily N-acetyltransferase
MADEAVRAEEHLPRPAALTPARWSVAAAVSRAVQVLREDGLATLWFKILGETFYRRVLILVCDLDGYVPEVRARIPVEFGMLEAGQEREYLAHRVGTPPDEIRWRLAAGHWCFVARHEGKIAGSAWAAPQRAWVDYLACEFSLEPKEVMTYDEYVSPEFRGNDLAAALAGEYIRYCRDKGYRRLLGTVLPENGPSLGQRGKTRYYIYGKMGRVWIGPWSRPFRHSYAVGSLRREAPGTVPRAEPQR